MVTALVVAAALAAPIAFVDAKGAEALAAHGATVLDAREADDYRAGHVAGAVSCPPSMVGAGAAAIDEAHGAALAKRLAALGVDGERPVVVYGGAGAGHGEEGWVAWLLVALGHSRVAILDGGFAAWREARRPISVAATTPARGRFSPHPARDVALARLVSVGTDGVRAVDVRDDDEWAAGHIPGAVHLPWRRVLDEKGRVVDGETLSARLRESGALRPQRGDTPIPPLVVYCAAGVRAAFVWAALTARGRSARVDDGSFEAWRAAGRLVEK